MCVCVYVCARVHVHVCVCMCACVHVCCVCVPAVTSKVEGISWNRAEVLTVAVQHLRAVCVLHRNRGGGGTERY